MGKLRKKLPKVPKGLKGDALTFTNDVAYDLIAINKAARVEDKARGLEVRSLTVTEYPKVDPYDYPNGSQPKLFVQHRVSCNFCRDRVLRKLARVVK